MGRRRSRRFFYKPRARVVRNGGAGGEKPFLLRVVKTIGAMFLSPLVLLLDAFHRRSQAGYQWRRYFLYLLLLAVVATWGLLLATERQTEKALQLFSDYSKMRFDVRATPYANLINFYAVRNNLDPSLVAAVIKQESGFQAEAVSPKGARGLMQLMPATWRQLNPGSKCDGEHRPPSQGGDCIFDPEANISAGTRYLRILLDRFNGDVVLAIAAYNAGAGRVSQYGRPGSTLGDVPPIPETQTYTRRVAQFWTNWRGEAVIWEISVTRFLKMALGWSFLVNFGLWAVLFVWLGRHLRRGL
ncbi:MAG: lytic transglycosylase domain-containing protein [Firmicutes bacterium]|nr:lytic transglycosylase domain-containing protein [Bacillota bacterium]